MLQADAQSVRARPRAYRERITAAAAATGWILTELGMVIEGSEELVPASAIEVDLKDLPEFRLAAVMRHLHDEEVPVELPRLLTAVEGWLLERGVTPNEAPVAVFRSGDAAGWHLVEAGGRYRRRFRATVRSAFTSMSAGGLQPTQAVVYPRTGGDGAPKQPRARLVWPVAD